MKNGNYFDISYSDISWDTGLMESHLHRRHGGPSGALARFCLYLSTLSQIPKNGLNGMHARKLCSKTCDKLSLVAKIVYACKCLLQNGKMNSKAAHWESLSRQITYKTHRIEFHASFLFRQPVSVSSLS